MSNFVKIRPVGIELFHAEGRKDGQAEQTDMVNLMVAFRKFANAPKNVMYHRTKCLGRP